MLIPIADAALQNSIFFALLLIAILIPARSKGADDSFLPPALSLEMKGFAILTVIFGHIGYFLSENHDFLFPLSTISGIGVDLFLLLSGFGLTVSALKHTRPLSGFYTRNALKLYLPLAIVLCLLFITDQFLLGKSYGLMYMLRSFAGFFPTADIFNDVDSPLWYFTFIVFLYALFPLVFSKVRILLSALAILMGSLAFTALSWIFFPGVAHLYLLHFLAFPLGIVLAWAGMRFPVMSRFIAKIKATSLPVRLTLLSLFAIAIVFLAVHTDQAGFEQLISLLIVVLLLCFFILKKSASLSLTLLGMYSYEIYLFHWPILYRYDVFYRFLPASIATASYLCLFIGLGFLFNALISLTLRIVKTG